MAGFLSTYSTCLLCHPALLFPPYPFAMAFIGGALLPVPRPSAAGTHIRRCCWTAPSPASARRRAPEAHVQDAAKAAERVAERRLVHLGREVADKEHGAAAGAADEQGRRGQGL